MSNNYAVYLKLLLNNMEYLTGKKRISILKIQNIIFKYNKIIIFKLYNYYLGIVVMQNTNWFQQSILFFKEKTPQYPIS